MPHCLSHSCLFWEILGLGAESKAACGERGAGCQQRTRLLCLWPALASQPILGKAAAAAGGGVLRDGPESASRNAQDALFPTLPTNVLGPGRGGS